jgi:5-methyltetrahydrofolate--homocysteine methyltransferase
MGVFDGTDILFFDGAMGTMLSGAGLPPGARPDVLNLLNPAAVERVHRAYREAGSDIVCTNTFGANAVALEKTGYTVREIITAGVSLARSGAPGALVALDVGPVGLGIEPYGDYSYDYAASLFEEQARIGAACGADLIAIETMMDITELRAAIDGVKRACALPVFATMTFEKSGRTFSGATAAQFALTAAELSADAIGINCSYLPEEIFSVFEELSRHSSLPLIAKPNAGRPDRDGTYSVTPEEFCAQMRPYAELGARVIGACCGSTPATIRALKNTFGKRD